MKVLITGGAGFVGRHLAPLLLARGDEITVLDIKLPLEVEARIPGVENRRGSVLDSEVVAELVSAAEMVVHLAGIAHPFRYGTDPLGTMEVNLQGSLNVARSCAAHGVPMLFASTSEIYGLNPDLPWNEESARLLGPVSEVRWCYATSKAAVEHYLDASRRQRGLKHAVVRFFNVYGAGLSGRVVDAFLSRALRRLPLRVHGNGEQTRCFCYVDDAIEAVVRILHGPEFQGRTYNVGNPQPTRIIDLARLILELTGSDSPLDFIAPLDVYEGFADIPHRQPDIARIRKEYGWSPKWDMADGLRAMISSTRIAREEDGMRPSPQPRVQKPRIRR